MSRGHYNRLLVGVQIPLQGSQGPLLSGLGPGVVFLLSGVGCRKACDWVRVSDVSAVWCSGGFCLSSGSLRFFASRGWVQQLADVLGSDSWSEAALVRGWLQDLEEGAR